MKKDTLNFLFFFLFLHSVSSLLSPTQKSTMINLSKLLQSSVSSFTWDINTDPCKWTGVTCYYEISDIPNLENSVSKLSLTNLRLSNSSFLSLACQIQSLEVLDVSKNLLNSIPDEFLVSCSKLSALKSLNISWNKVSGPLPTFEKGFTNLESLDLSHNSLSGNIGVQLNALVSLKSLNLSSNNFTGSVPPMPQCLQTLDLSNNILEGHIPPYISELKYLVSLDLSNNRISGAITHYSKDVLQSELFMSLSSLNLSYNLLSGPIPPMLQNFKKEAFIGNLDLCGKPLTVNCHESIDIGLYVSIGLGFYLGFWGVCGTLVLKDAWRHALFNFVDNIYNNIYVTVAIYVARFKRNAQT